MVETMGIVLKRMLQHANLLKLRGEDHISYISEDPELRDTVHRLVMDKELISADISSRYPALADYIIREYRV